jgi:putative peptide zinc metalloprotease protein
MHDQPDHGVREIGSTRLELRGDLIFTPQTSGNQPYYMVEDPLNSRFFRLGHSEYAFVSLLDGGTTIHEALTHLSTVMPNHRLRESDAAGLCRWLIEMDLAHTAESSQAVPLARTANSLEQRRALARFNPLVFRLPLCQPDAVFAALTKPIGWLYSWWAAVVWLLLVAIGTYQVFSDWDHFTASSQGIFSAGNRLWLVACWSILKVVHEISHGVVCKLHGGEVRETGVLFILFAPLAYVDVTSSWRFRSQWQRIHVAAAGMYIELLIAAVAALVWSSTNSGWLNNMCFNVIVMASLTTLAFNANPLMKFDGYYMLSDALAMPNLYTNGQSYLRYWARRYLLGVPATLPNWPRSEGALIRVYGWASFAWRIVVCVSLTITAATMFHGAGIVLACVALVMWLGLPTLRFVKYFVFGEPGEQPHRFRFILTTGSATAICAIVFGFVTWPGTREAPAVVEYAPSTVIRAASAGFVSEIRVASGQQVERGQLLVVLENRQLARDLSDLELQIRQSEIRGRRSEQQGELAAQQAEMKKREGLQSQLAEKRAQVERLTVRAPCAGKIIRRDLATIIGTYLNEGDEIATIGDESKKELQISISQDDLEVFAGQVGKLGQVEIPRYSPLQSTLEKVMPRASLTPLHPALATANGGPLPVNTVGREGNDTAGATFELFAPRFTGIVRLNETESGKLRAGQRGTFSCRALHESIGEHLYHAVSRWVRERSP